MVDTETKCCLRVRTDMALSSRSSPLCTPAQGQPGHGKQKGQRQGDEPQYLGRQHRHSGRMGEGVRHPACGARAALSWRGSTPRGRASRGSTLWGRAGDEGRHDYREQASRVPGADDGGAGDVQVRDRAGHGGGRDGREQARRIPGADERAGGASQMRQRPGRRGTDRRFGGSRRFGRCRTRRAGTGRRRYRTGWARAGRGGGGVRAGWARAGRGGGGAPRLGPAGGWGSPSGLGSRWAWS